MNYNYANGYSPYEMYSCFEINESKRKKVKLSSVSISLSFSLFVLSFFFSLCYINLDENNNNLNDDDDDVLMLSFSVTLVENNSYADFILHATDSISFSSCRFSFLLQSCCALTLYIRVYWTAKETHDTPRLRRRKQQKKNNKKKKEASNITWICFPSLCLCY